MSSLQYYLHRSNCEYTGDALPQSNDLVCIEMEKNYPLDAICPKIESLCLLFQNILKRTKEKTKEEQTASKALASVSKVSTLHSLLPSYLLDLPHMHLEIQRKPLSEGFPIA